MYQDLLKLTLWFWIGFSNVDTCNVFLHYLDIIKPAFCLLKGHFIWTKFQFSLPKYVLCQVLLKLICPCSSREDVAFCFVFRYGSCRILNTCYTLFEYLQHSVVKQTSPFKSHILMPPRSKNGGHIVFVLSVILSFSLKV